MEKKSDKKLTMDRLAALCKEYGFIFAGSEIYDGLANTWDYGPLGARIKNAVKDAWRKRFVQEQKNAFEVDSGILMHPRVWEASGHVSNFNDPLVDCKACKKRFRLDHLIDGFDSGANADGMSEEQMGAFLKERKIPCPSCGKFDYTDIRKFALMFETERGVTEGNKIKIYLRPENAQGEYVNFLNVANSMRAKLPFGIGQIGKAFRNEITPGNFIFRTIEFEQMEYQIFCKKGEDDAFYDGMKEYAMRFFTDLGIDRQKLRSRDHEKLAFYAKAAADIEFLFPFGWGEINGTHNRTDYDLSRHQEYSGKNLYFVDSATGEKIVPYIVESTVGADRAVLAVLCDAYEEEALPDGTTREVLRLLPYLAPYKCAVLPLIKNRHADKAKKIWDKFSKEFPVVYDETQSIGKRYRRQDIIGTPYCITVDDDTLEKGTVTVRDRDSMEQQIMTPAKAAAFIKKQIKF